MVQLSQHGSILRLVGKSKAFKDAILASEPLGQRKTIKDFTVSLKSG